MKWWGWALGAIGAIAVVEAVTKRPAAAAPVKGSTDQAGAWAPGDFVSKVKVGERLIVKFSNPGANRAYGVNFVPFSGGPSILELTPSNVSGPDQAILTGKSVGSADVTIDLFDDSAMIAKPLVLNGVVQRMTIHVDVVLP